VDIGNIHHEHDSILCGLIETADYKSPVQPKSVMRDL